jgi:DNA invertase Pin-like site-specific DNA recombinase
MKRIAYLRVSTDSQNIARQVDGLQGIADELHVERLSAVARHRPVYERVVQSLEPGDVLVVWDIDRAYRSLKDAVIQLDILTERGIRFHIAKMNIDTRTPDGRYQYNIMSAGFQLEREKLVERTKEGIEAARARGKRIGRPPKMTDLQLFEAHRRVLARLETMEKIAADYGVTGWTLSRALARSIEGLPN